MQETVSRINENLDHVRNLSLRLTDVIAEADLKKNNAIKFLTERYRASQKQVTELVSWLTWHGLHGTVCDMTTLRADSAAQ